MAEVIVKINGDKRKQYESLLPQIHALVRGETDRIANLANVASALFHSFPFLWVGFYIVKSEELILGPFQGPIACTRIAKGAGVCGSAWEQSKTVIVDDVDTFPGHIACSSLSKSEIVVPLIKDGVVIAVLDIDSQKYSAFDAVDEEFLTDLCKWLVSVI